MNKISIFITSVFIFCTISFFCAMTPLVFDDFGYGTGGSNLSDIFKAQVQEHLAWSGKFIGHFMARVLLHGPSWLHPLLTPLIFLGLVLCAVLLTLGAQWRDKIRAWHLITLAGLIWFALPAFGTVYFWRTGTADYGYSLFFATAFLVPYRFWIDKKNYHLAGGPVFALAGVLAGCSNENVGMLAILAALGATIYRFRTLKTVPAWAAAGIIGAVSGWLVMMAAPGNAVRLAQLGGVEKIPAFSFESFHRFLIFWSSQQLEMSPYILVALVCIWLLYRQDRLKIATFLPGFVFFLMAQASLAAFIFSPSTPYRAMSATFFYTACCCFAFIAALNLKNVCQNLLYAAFCLVLLSSVLMEAHVFIQAQPAIAKRNQAMKQGTVTAESFDYPQTDKYFFPTYDIIEINAYADSQKYQMIPWNKAVLLNVEGTSGICGLVISNMVYLDNLPSGTVHVAAIAHRQTVSSAIQAVLRYLSPLKKTTSMSAVVARYAPASTPTTTDGKASLHIPGVTNLNDVAYIGIEENGKPMVWRRVYE